MEQAVKDLITGAAQARPPGETSWYSPARDLSVLFPALIRNALRAWEDTENEYRYLSDRCAFADRDIGKMAEALAAFISKENIVDADSYVEAYAGSGLTDIPAMARCLVMGMIGEEVLCAFWHCIRTATTSTDGEELKITQYDPDILVSSARRIARLMRVPRWRRNWTIRWWRWRTWIKEKIGGNDT